MAEQGDTQKLFTQLQVLKNEVEKPKIETKKKDKDEKIEVIKNADIDPVETKEWLESLSAVLEKDGKNRAQYLIKQLIDYSYKEGSDLVLSRNTPYTNTIAPEDEKKSLKVLCQGAAMRFLLTRVFDFLNLTEGAIVKIKDPVEYLKRLEFHDNVSGYQDYFF